MARRRQEIEAFVRHLVVEFEAAEAAGMLQAAVARDRLAQRLTAGLAAHGPIG